MPSVTRNLLSHFISSSTNASTASLHTSIPMLARTTVLLSENTSSSFIIQMSSSVSPTSTQATTPSTSQIPSTISRGFCAPYTGTTCRAVLDQTLTAFNESERFFDRKYGINKTEEFAKIIAKMSEQQKPAKPQCKRLLHVAFCQQTFLACLPNGKPISLCREDCEKLSQECSADLNRLIGSTSAIKDLEKVDFFHLSLPTNCSRYPSGKTGNNSCYYTGLFDHTPLEPHSTSSNIVLYASVGAGSFALIIIIAGVVCFKYRRNKKRKEEEAVDAMILADLEDSSTMKARISMLRTTSSLSTKLAELYDPDKLKQFSLDKIEYVCDLGEGQFGLVFKGMAIGLDESKDPSFPTPVAVKTLKKDSNDDSKKEFDQEVALMSILDHPNIVKLMAVATLEDPYCMIFEFMDHGDLNQFLREIRPLVETEQPHEIQLCLEDFLSICRQVASGMEYLGTLHFVHRDLATRNCLVGEGLEVKIADFGLSRDIYSADYYKVRGDAMLPVRWMPPEALLHGRFTVESDIYSYGILMWEVFTYALQPFYGYSNEEVLNFAKQGVLLGQPDDCPKHIYNLMCECWSRNPQSRPDFTAIIKRLVRDPPESAYSKPKSTNEYNTVPKPGNPNLPDTTNETNSNYQKPGTTINSGFVPDTASETVSPESNDAVCDKNDEKSLSTNAISQER